MHSPTHNREHKRIQQVGKELIEHAHCHPRGLCRDAGRGQRALFCLPSDQHQLLQTLNAALQGFTEAGSDGIVQVSTGGAEYASGPTIKNMVTGAVALAEYAHEVAKNYPVNIALHTDHCPKDKLDGYVRPLLAISTERVKAGGLPLFQSHMWDGSAVPLEENLSIAEELLAQTSAANVILEIEVGVVGGEEDGVSAEINEKLYTQSKMGCGPSKCSAPATRAATSQR